MSTKQEKPVMRWLFRFIKWVVIPLLVLEVVMWAAFRWRYRPIIDGVRAFNKRILNPAMMKRAGGEHWYAGVIRHTGRKSGKEYETPILAEPTPDGFLIPLPYGEQVDWLKNVLAAGKCEIENKGVNYPVAEPEVVSREEAEPFLSSRRRRQLGLYGIDKYLKVKRHAGRLDQVAHEGEQRKKEVKQF
jgi:deazaflavin-dependent oxidoreductase (nitroreductase family)